MSNSFPWTVQDSKRMIRGVFEEYEEFLEGVLG